MSEYYSLPLYCQYVLNRESNHKLRKVDVKTSIDQHLQLLVMTRFGEFRYDVGYGCAVCELDFMNEQQTGSFSRIIQRSCVESITRYEPRLMDVNVSVTFDRNGEFYEIQNAPQLRIFIRLDISGRVKDTNRFYEHTIKVYFSPVTDM